MRSDARGGTRIPKGGGTPEDAALNHATKKATKTEECANIPKKPRKLKMEKNIFEKNIPLLPKPLEPG